MFVRAVRLTQPVIEPVTLDEAKRQLRIPMAQTTEDEIISAYISAARDQAEQFIDSAICESDFVLVYDQLTNNKLTLSYPARSVSNVSHVDASGNSESLNFSYDAQLNTVYFETTLNVGDIKVTATCGDLSDFPQSLKQAVLLLVADLYTGRTSADTVNKAAQAMLMPFKNRPVL